jgi:hypothetical protein
MFLYFNQFVHNVSSSFDSPMFKQSARLQEYTHTVNTVKPSKVFICFNAFSSRQSIAHESWENV